MSPSAPPKAVAIEVVATQPTEADREVIAHLKARDNKGIPEVAYLVKIRFETAPVATSQGWALYVNDQRIPKYWGYKDGIYFKVFDPQFFDDHHGEPLRFSLDGTELVDTGLKLEKPKATARKTVREGAKLPSQTKALE
jgi:hypothetical protein